MFLLWCLNFRSVPVLHWGVYKASVQIVRTGMPGRSLLLSSPTEIYLSNCRTDAILCYYRFRVPPGEWKMEPSCQFPPPSGPPVSLLSATRYIKCPPFLPPSMATTWSRSKANSRIVLLTGSFLQQSLYFLNCYTQQEESRQCPLICANMPKQRCCLWGLVNDCKVAECVFVDSTRDRQQRFD